MSMRKIVIEPITRIEGHLGAVVDVDEATRTPKDAYVFATMFRGFEVFLRTKPPEDAIAITSRICGVCGASHSNASMHAVDMAYGAVPQPLGVLLRNMGFLMTDHLYDHSIILNILGAPDYSSLYVKKLTPMVYQEAQETLSPRRDIHGFTRISDIMDGFVPVAGKIWNLTVRYQRFAKEAGIMIYGKHPHPSTIIPGGIATDLTNPDSLIVGYTFRLNLLTAWVKYVYAIWEDLVWFYEEVVGYRDQGKTYDKPNYVSGGLFDDPEAYSSLSSEPEEFYKGMDEVALKRGIKPGIMINGELVSTSYKEINVSISEDVKTSFYEEWSTLFTDKDPEGTPLLWGKVNPVHHPWNKTTIPSPQPRDFSKKYSWVADVRLVWKDGTITPFEVGPLARLTVTAYQPSDLGPGNGILRVDLPKSGGATDLPESVSYPMTLAWRAPAYSTTMQRLLARAFSMVIHASHGWQSIVKAAELIRSGKVATSRPWKAPSRRTFGVGFTEAPRGTVRHWVVQEGGKIVNYQIHAPTTGNASPKDEYGRAPFEMSLLNSKVTEEVGPSEWQGLDYVRAIRSFDPCIACAVHVRLGSREIYRPLF
jgi:hydrogenase large subunit